MLVAGDPRSVDIDCEGNRCLLKNVVVKPEIVGNGVITVGIIGEAPYTEEVKYGRPFIGRTGLFLRQYFDLDKYRYHIFNSVMCLSYDEDVPIKPSEMSQSDYELRMKKCSRYRDQVLDLLDDESVVMVFGRFAKLAMFGDASTPNSVFPISHFDMLMQKTFYMFSNYHPAHILYRPSSKGVFDDIMTASGVFKMPNRERE